MLVGVCKQWRGIVYGRFRHVVGTTLVIRREQGVPQMSIRSPEKRKRCSWMERHRAVTRHRATSSIPSRIHPPFLSSIIVARSCIRTIEQVYRRSFIERFQLENNQIDTMHSTIPVSRTPIYILATVYIDVIQDTPVYLINILRTQCYVRLLFT